MSTDLKSYADWKERGVEYSNDDFVLFATGSYWNGKERVWINDQLVSEKTNFLLRTIHEFEHNGEKFVIEFNKENFVTGKLRVTAHQNSAQLFSDTKSPYRWWFLPVTFVVAILFGYAVGYIEGRFFV